MDAAPGSDAVEKDARRGGGCVCGRVRYVATGSPLRVTVCHCAWCQRRTGTAFGAEAVFPQGMVAYTAARPKSYRHVSDRSGRWVEQHFCADCGANTGMALEAAPELVTVAAGTFDDPSWLRREGVEFRYVFMRSAQCWSEVPDGALTYAEHFRD